MDNVQDEILALLREMQGDDHKRDLAELEGYPGVPYRQPTYNSNGHEQQLRQPQASTSHIYSQQSLYQSQPTRQLDHFLRAQQRDHPDAERSVQPRRQLPLSTPEEGYYDQNAPQLPLESRTRRDVHPTRRFQDTQAASFHTPPVRNASTLSSPSTHLASSPTFGVSQRRSIHDPSHDGSVPSHARQIPSRSLAGPSFKQNSRAISREIDLDHAPPMVQGIQLISLNELPDRFRSVFPFPVFNAIQSKCYRSVYESDDNLVVSAPTGGGKTAILEMAMCRLVSTSGTGQYKIVYMAPTKSLCSERQRDWQSKFATLGLTSAELTGDTDQAQLKHVQNASVIITTPEKWDSMTRKWKDHARLMQLVKLFLIDEVHILKDTRGATLEAVVSRMKSVGSNVRFVALSATVPNSSDIATWLGRDSNNRDLPACQERFGEEFRPVKLKKFVYGLPYRGNDFGFEPACDLKLPEIIARYSQKKPMMIFCCTRKSTIVTAKMLAALWATRNPLDRQWPEPNQRISVKDLELRNTISSGVAFHHAGLDSSDRHVVEKSFLEGKIFVICCTSTLAVGVNLPCHLVIIKNTVCYQDGGLKEYADLEIMQMLGRAGRPQFDDNAIAVIITKQDKVQKYEKMVSGTELLESCLHLNLVDHLNAEIVLGTIYDLPSAKRWLMGTFLFVRLQQNPNHYQINEDLLEQSLDDRMERICQRDINLLLDTKLITFDRKLKSTEFGEAMARYYVKFKTMQTLLRLEPRCKMSEILFAVAEAEEFSEIRLRAGEKTLFKELNKANGLKFPIKVDIAQSAHKRCLIIQAELGGVEFPADEHYLKHKKQYLQDKAIIFSHIHRLIKCVIDCQIYLQDAVAAKHALELLRSFGAKVWDNSPYQMKQVPQIGLVAIRKLALGGINSIELLESAEPHRIEMLLSKNPPFGAKLLASLQDFPKLWVSVKMMGKEVTRGQPVKINFRVQCGFLNHKIPMFYNKKPLFVCLLVERSDGRLVDFRRISARLLSNGQDVLLSADLVHHSQHITCNVMCDEIAGTTRHADLAPGLSASLFSLPSPLALGHSQDYLVKPQNHSVGRLTSSTQNIHNLMPRNSRAEEFFDDDINDQDLIDAADDMDFYHIDSFDTDMNPDFSQLRPKAHMQPRAPDDVDSMLWNPKQLKNGKWPCKHNCKDKTACKHLCCREGVDKPPKPPKNRTNSTAAQNNGGLYNTKAHKLNLEVDSRLQMNKSVNFEKNTTVQKMDLSKDRDLDHYAKIGPRDYRKLHRLHDSVNKGPGVPLIPKKKISFPQKEKEKAQPLTPIHTFDNIKPNNAASSSCGSGWTEEFPSPSAMLVWEKNSTQIASSPIVNQSSDLLTFEEDFPELEIERLEKQNPAGFVDSKGEDLAYPIDEQDSMVDSSQELPAPLNLNKASPLKNVDRLFSSTESPRKMLTPPEKRKFTYEPEKGNTTDEGVHDAKRRRVSTQTGEEVLQASSTGENQASIPLPRPSPIIQKSGRPRPAWVDDFDPDFVADYADIVEFI